MKHTFVFIDKLIILLKYVPRSLDTEEDKTKARNVITLIHGYTYTLKKLINAHKNKKYLERLHKAHIAQIEDWAEKVDSAFEKLDLLLEVLDRDAKKLEAVIKNEPQKWQSVVSDMALGMVLTGLHDEEEDMKRFRGIALFEIHELEEIISHDKHNKEVHEWEKIIDYEKHFIELLE